MGQHARFIRFHGHRRLVGLDIGQFFARPDLIALFLVPFDDRSFGHGVGKLGHGDLGGHEDLKIRISIHDHA